jgi:hypothetical protein
MADPVSDLLGQARKAAAARDAQTASAQATAQAIADKRAAAAAAAAANPPSQQTTGVNQ